MTCGGKASPRAVDSPLLRAASSRMRPILPLREGGASLWTNRRILATILVLFGFLLFGSLRFRQSVNPPGRFHLSKASDASLTEKPELARVIVSRPESSPSADGWQREGRLRFLLRVQETKKEEQFAHAR